VASSLDLKQVQALLRNHPYAQFPAVIEGQICGVLTRGEADRAIREKRAPVLVKATICAPDLSLRAVEMQLIESQTGFLLLQDPVTGNLVGILTLHDILRAQQAAAEEGYA
jgi:CBS domain-containing protein